MTGYGVHNVSKPPDPLAQAEKQQFPVGAGNRPKGAA